MQGFGYRALTDSYLYHLVGDADRSLEGPAPVSLESMVRPADFEAAGPTPARILPVLLRLRHASWRGEHLGAEFHETSRLGDVAAGLATLRGLDLLERDGGIVAIELSREAGEPDLEVSLPAVRANLVQRPPVGERGARALVGLIDVGLDVLHEAFRRDDEVHTRILALWDQHDPSGPPPPGKAYGTLHTSEDIDRYIANGRLEKALQRDPAGHGTHVASIAAGRATGSFSGGVAPEAAIVAVIPKLTSAPGDPVSIGYSVSHVDALDFIAGHALERALPVVVNVSLGMNAGAHDGSSVLEAAFDNFTNNGLASGRAIVKSAGNSATQDTHARLQLGSHMLAELRWQSTTASRHGDTIEIWFRASDELELTLRNPRGAGGPTLSRSEPRVESLLDQNLCRMTFDRFYRDNGDSRALVTITPGNAERILAGEWTLELRSRVVQSRGLVDAWMERRSGRPTFFTSRAEDESTVTIPGTARSVISVGAVDRELRGLVADFSSRGPTRDGRPKPDISAPGVDILAARAGTAQGSIALSGTSMAAPHVTGAIALLLSRLLGRHGDLRRVPNAAQIRAALTQESAGFNGTWLRDRGWGMLDVEALFRALD